MICLTLIAWMRNKEQVKTKLKKEKVKTKLKMLAIEGAYVNHTPSLFD